MSAEGNIPPRRPTWGEHNPILVVNYDPQWPAVFADLSRVIFGCLGELALAIEHIGSTSVPGLAAKPIIDFDVVVESRQAVSVSIERLARLGYVHQGDLDVPGREAFRRDGDEEVPRDGSGRKWPTHNLYVCARDNEALGLHLAFRDYLRQNPREVAVYAELKRALALQFPHDIDAYVEGKTEFVEGVLRRQLR